MKKLLTFAIAASLCAFSFAQEGPKGEGGRPKKHEDFSKMMSGMDVGTRVQLLKKYDKDGDGRLDKKERAEAMKAIKGKVADLEEIKAKHAEHVIKKFDADGDGKLDKKELIGFLDDQRKMMDKARENMMRRRGNFNPPKEILAKYDKDGDGKLSAEERKAMFKDAAERRAALMKKYDADGDGQLNDEERLKLTQDPEIQNMFKRMLNTNRPPRGGGDNPPPPPPPPND